MIELGKKRGGCHISARWPLRDVCKHCLFGSQYQIEFSKFSQSCQSVIKKMDFYQLSLTNIIIYHMK